MTFKPTSRSSVKDMLVTAAHYMSTDKPGISIESTATEQQFAEAVDRIVELHSRDDDSYKPVVVELPFLLTIDTRAGREQYNITLSKELLPFQFDNCTAETVGILASHLPLVGQVEPIGHQSDERVSEVILLLTDFLTDSYKSLLAEVK